MLKIQLWTDGRDHPFNGYVTESIEELEDLVLAGKGFILLHRSESSEQACQRVKTDRVVSFDPVDSKPSSLGFSR